MLFKTRGYVATLVGPLAMVFAYAQTKPGDDPPTISICTLFRELRSYSGEMVAVRGMLYRGREIFAIGGHCDFRFRTHYNSGLILPGLPETGGGEFEWPIAVDLKPSDFIEAG